MGYNFTVTFRNVGKKKGKNIEEDVLSLIKKHNVKSAGIDFGSYDVNDETTHQKQVDEPKYILQFNDSCCCLITILNAIIHKTGESPIEYKSSEFWDLVAKTHR